MNDIQISTVEGKRNKKDKTIRMEKPGQIGKK